MRDARDEPEGELLETARSAFEHLGRALGNTLLWISDLLDPDVIVLGGAVATSFRHFEVPVAAVLRERQISVVTSVLGDSAALCGAATVAFSGLREESQT